MQILNLTKQSIPAHNAVFAINFKDRLFGMIGKDFSSFDAMVFDRCSAIHSMFMKIPIDVIFVSADCHVLKTIQNFLPWRPFAGCKKSFYVIELPVGSIAVSNTAKGDILDLSAVLTPETEKNWNKQRIMHAVKSNALPLKQRINK